MDSIWIPPWKWCKISVELWFHEVIPYHSIWNPCEKVWIPCGKSMDSMWKKYGIHVEKYGFHQAKVWNPSTKSMESINHSMESISQKYGIHPPFHGIHQPLLESTSHSIHSMWNNLGRVKYWMSSTLGTMSGSIKSRRFSYAFSITHDDEVTKDDSSSLQHEDWIFTAVVSGISNDNVSTDANR